MNAWEKGYRIIRNDYEEGGFGHRIGCVRVAQLPFCHIGRESFLCYALFDLRDQRVEPKISASLLPILFHPEYELADTPLIYSVNASGHACILQQTSEVSDGSAEVRPTTEYSAKLSPLPDDVAYILSEATKGNWPSASNKENLPKEMYERLLSFCLVQPYHQLGGASLWIQGVISARCHVCDEEMSFFATLDTDQKLGWHFGDEGRLYVFICSRCSVVRVDMQTH